MEGFPTLKSSWLWSWPWIGSYCIPSCITHRPLRTRQISMKSKKRFVDGWTYGQTDGRIDGHLRLALLVRLCQRVSLKMVLKENKAVRMFTGEGLGWNMTPDMIWMPATSASAEWDIMLYWFHESRSHVLTNQYAR